MGCSLGSGSAWPRLRVRPYEKRNGPHKQLKDGPTFKHVRLGVMEWIRRRTKSEYRMDSGHDIWNQTVMRNIGKGPPPPKPEPGQSLTVADARAYANKATQRMRITCGMRTGTIAGGPQGEKQMERAALTHAASAYIIRGGCRGCMAKGKWPGERETTAHCICDCACKNVNDLIRWKRDVQSSLKYMISHIRKLGDDAHTLYAQLQLALAAMTSKCPQGEEFVALRRTVGGAMPWWDRNMEYRDKKHNKALTAMIDRLQDLFIERVGEWTAYMAPSGWQRQRTAKTMGSKRVDAAYI